ncbi:MAG: phosphatidylglycerophosphatase A [Nitrospirota bacterium]
MKSLHIFVSKAIATVLFIGFIPFAPGTFGSLAGVAYLWLVKPDTPLLLITIIVGFVAGVISAREAGEIFGEEDSRHIVIDELIGYFISMLYLPVTVGYLVAAFVLFRIFDILKPPPIRNIERAVRGGLGVMLDDVVAGIFTNVILQVVARV